MDSMNQYIYFRHSDKDSIPFPFQGIPKQKGTGLVDEPFFTLPQKQ